MTALEEEDEEAKEVISGPQQRRDILEKVKDERSFHQYMQQIYGQIFEPGFAIVKNYR